MTNAEKAYHKVCKVLGQTPAKVKPIETPEGTTLVIVPNKVFTWAKIKKLAVEFGKDQPYETYIYEDLYKKYSAEELSSKPTGEKYRAIYIPKEYNVEADTVENQRKKHAKEHVPSVLEAICFWYALRENGDTLDFDSTYIRHFDMEPQRLDGFLYVPVSYVNDDGDPYLRYSAADNDSDARVLVGGKLEIQISPFPFGLVPSGLEARVKALEDWKGKVQSE